MRKLFSLVEKEVKDLLRDPRIYIGLVVPVVMLPLIGLMMETAMSSSIEASTKDLRVAMLDCDGTMFSEDLINLLLSSGIDVRLLDVVDLEAAIGGARDSGSKALIVIQKGFEDNLINFRRGDVEVYAIVEDMGLSSVGAYSAIEGLLSLSSKILSNMLVSNLNPNVSPEVVREPLNITMRSIIKDKIIEIPPQTLFGQLMMGYAMIIPMLLLVLSITVIQFAATATAVENEEKTLETLLTFPVTRYDILLAKLLGSSVLAVIGGVLFTIGFLVYFNNIFMMSGFNNPMGGFSDSLPSPPPESFVLLTLSLILAILFTTSLGVVIGALSSDVRMANSLLGIVIIPIIIPSLSIMYGDLKMMPLALQLLMYALPTTYPMLIAKEMVITPMPVALFGVPYSAALTILILYVTSMLLVPEKLLTIQYRLKLRGTKKKQVKELE
ncbi:MAG: ABC transporter permease [Thermoproteota archaeon]